MAETDLLAEVVHTVLAGMPAWIRADLTARQPAARARAEEVLAAKIADALRRSERRVHPGIEGAKS